MTNFFSPERRELIRAGSEALASGGDQFFTTLAREAIANAVIEVVEPLIRAQIAQGILEIEFPELSNYGPVSAAAWMRRAAHDEAVKSS